MQRTGNGGVARHTKRRGGASTLMPTVPFRLRTWSAGILAGERSADSLVRIPLKYRRNELHQSPTRLQSTIHSLKSEA